MKKNCKYITKIDAEQIARVVEQVVTKRIRKEKLQKLKSKFNI